TCIHKGYLPSSCKLPARFADAVDACLDKGFLPDSCATVTDAECIRHGSLPSACSADDDVSAPPPPPRQAKRSSPARTTTGTVTLTINGTTYTERPGG